MSLLSRLFEEQTLDSLILDIKSFRVISGASEIIDLYLAGDYTAILKNPTSQDLFRQLSKSRTVTSSDTKTETYEDEISEENANLVLIIISGLAAFNAFLQANVTGPPLELREVFKPEGISHATFRDKCLASLDVDGVSVYQHIPHVDLFCLARFVFTTYLPRLEGTCLVDCKWMRIRINAYHQRLLSSMSGSSLNDTVTIQNMIEKDVQDFELEIMNSKYAYSTEAKVQFLLEKAQIYIVQGLDIKASDNVQMAKTVSGFVYTLSGALGKRTKFQQTEISQLVVLAKSSPSHATSTNLSKSVITSTEDISRAEFDEKRVSEPAPVSLELNDDTLLEAIEFSKKSLDQKDDSSLPPELSTMQPDEQPQLNALDQIILLSEATLKDSFSPLDKLNSEEILPYALRVLNDKPTNWQIYTQALLVRSRIESHRSRTQERSVLQMQAIVDQIVADTQGNDSAALDGSIPEIRVTQFLPRVKASESAPVMERLKYIHPLSSPTRWEVETELAFAWSGVGSFVSALEIFKRLHLWPEVALCYHSIGQEDKARQIIRRQLHYSSRGKNMDEYHVDAAEVITEQWDGEIRTPPPPHSPRMWCILGDLDNDPACWERAWDISKRRYARAQRALGQYYSQKNDWDKARDAYINATAVNRQNQETWSRLGDIDLRVGNWDGAVIAFQQAIMIDETDAKTYNNLGSALLSKYTEMSTTTENSAATEETELLDRTPNRESGKSARDTLYQALLAFKRGANLAHDNWKIWDNVITIAIRINPPSFPEILLGMRAIIRIRSPQIGESAIDIDILRNLVTEVTSQEHQLRPDGNSNLNTRGIYDPPRGTLASATLILLTTDIEPLITTRHELYVLLEKFAFWRRDYAAALAYAEKAWRMATLTDDKWNLGGDEPAWLAVVATTENLVGAYENYGPMERSDASELVEKAWKAKARNAVRSVLGKARDGWEESGGYKTLQDLLDAVKNM